MKDLKISRDGPREMSEALAKRLFADIEWTIGNRMIFLKVGLSCLVVSLLKQTPPPPPTPREADLLQSFVDKFISLKSFDCMVASKL